MSNSITIDNIYKLFQKSQEKLDSRFSEIDKRLSKMEASCVVSSTANILMILQTKEGVAECGMKYAISHNLRTAPNLVFEI